MEHSLEPRISRTNFNRRAATLNPTTGTSQTVGNANGDANGNANGDEIFCCHFLDGVSTNA